jgi:hypothetical protein
MPPKRGKSRGAAPSTRGSTRTQPREDTERVADNDTNESLLQTVSHLKQNATEAQDAIDNIRNELQSHGNQVKSLHDRFDSLAEDIRTSCGTGPRTNTRDPFSFVKTHLPWINQTLLSNIVAGKLDPKDLIQLLPEEERPSRKAGGRNQLILDSDGKITTLDEPYTSFDKDFPSSEYLISAFSIYGTIRGLYDVDNLGFAHAIPMHVRRIARDVLYNKYEWHSVVTYFIAHFRKHQTSSDPLVWVTTDTELFVSHIKSPQNSTVTPQQPPLKQRPSSPTKRPAPDPEFCINYNTHGKGCTWQQCFRSHNCLDCSAAGHPSWQCPKSKKHKPDQPPK